VIHQIGIHHLWLSNLITGLAAIRGTCLHPLHVFACFCFIVAFVASRRHRHRHVTDSVRSERGYAVASLQALRWGTCISDILSERTIATSGVSVCLSIRPSVTRWVGLLSLRFFVVSTSPAQSRSKPSQGALNDPMWNLVSKTMSYTRKR